MAEAVAAATAGAAGAAPGTAPGTAVAGRPVRVAYDPSRLQSASGSGGRGAATAQPGPLGLPTADDAVTEIEVAERVSYSR